MSYQVKEIYFTLQGEGAQTGRAAVFLRFAGCNLWSGLERDRADAVCKFCDTDFVGVDGPGGGKFSTAETLVDAVNHCWTSLSPTGGEGKGEGDAGNQKLEIRSLKDSVSASNSDFRLPGSDFKQPPHPNPLPQGGRGRPLVVCTGGEPLLQLDEALIDALHVRGFEIAIETNGTIAAPSGIDWICVSPKSNAELKQRRGNELKLVYPQSNALPEKFASLHFEHFFLQPMDGPSREANTQAAIKYCLSHPQWRLSLQTHKLIGIP
ncbi:MAG TPA: 7-carboxy-7-deazaguanine synthase QueE [Rhizomicrobium sp.]|nr:7-carboxy-7-deazaguanine synthase QueE [Rhizomicrobium sp.]